MRVPSGEIDGWENAGRRRTPPPRSASAGWRHERCRSSGTPFSRCVLSRCASRSGNDGTPCRRGTLKALRCAPHPSDRSGATITSPGGVRGDGGCLDCWNGRRAPLAGARTSAGGRHRLRPRQRRPDLRLHAGRGVQLRRRPRAGREDPRPEPGHGLRLPREPGLPAPRRGVVPRAGHRAVPRPRLRGADGRQRPRDRPRPAVPTRGWRTSTSSPSPSPTPAS